MKRSAFMVLLMLLSVLLEPLGPWQSRGRLSGAAQTEARREGPNSRPYQGLTVALREGSFVLRDLRLTSVGGSTKISGKLVNQTKQQWQGIMLSLTAYDASGRQLRGVERQTIFGFNQLEKGKSALINSGYGVWLEGVPLQSIARLEVGLLNDEQRDSHHRSSGNLADMEE